MITYRLGLALLLAFVLGEITADLLCTFDANVPVTIAVKVGVGTLVVIGGVKVFARWTRS